jgi:hypothetical protein
VFPLIEERFQVKSFWFERFTREGVIESKDFREESWRERMVSTRSVGELRSHAEHGNEEGWGSRGTRRISR